jgi:pyruvate,water dikinase
MVEPQPLVLPIDRIRAADLPLVGGKGANLGELAGAGFPVPPGFCVTTTAFRRFLAAAGERSEAMYGELEALAPGDVDGVRRVGAQIRAELAAVAVPDEVTVAVLAAWEALGAEHAYAVRSSATAEDLPGASFAGQQDTFLNVRGREALLAAVRACWISLFTDRAILYRAQSGFDHRTVLLSVVVQRMVWPEVSGILFTADPLSGHRQVASIDAGFGLGEALVSGLVSADLYRVDKRTLDVIEARVAEKELAIRPRPEGGTVREALGDVQRNARALSDEQAVALTVVSSRIEAHYGQPQDIEWCIDGDGEIFIVQSRPITSLFPLPEPAPSDDALHLYFSFGHLQVMTDAINPMGRSVLRTLVPFGKPGAPTEENPYAPAAGGRIYLDATPLMAVRPLRHVAPKILTVGDVLIADGVRQVVERPEFLDGLPHLSRRTKPHELARFFLPVLWQAQLWLWWRPLEEAGPWVTAFCDDQVEQIRARLAVPPAGLARVGEARLVLASTMLRFFPRLMPVIAAGGIARALLLRLGADPGEVDALLRGLNGNATTEMDLAVGDLADVARQSPAVVERLTAQNPAAALSRLDEVAGGREFLAALDAFLERYGMRGPSEIDISRPRLRDDPTPVLQVVVGNLRHDGLGAHRAHHRQLAVAGEAAVGRLAAAARRGALGPLRAVVVRRLARAARHCMALREHPKFMLVRVLGTVRLALLEAADVLVAEGRLASVEDVWLLTLGELITALEDPAADLSPRIAARRGEHARDSGLRPPRVMTSDGEIPEVGHDRTDLPPGALPGSAASMGIAEGIARVVLDPRAEVLQRGEILVAPFTDPGWTPLFINAAGLVMEVGGLMTHGSVVAREYGIPAVVGVLDATRVIHTGQRLRVNGDRGYVEVLGDGREEGG